MTRRRNLHELAWDIRIGRTDGGRGASMMDVRTGTAAVDMPAVEPGAGYSAIRREMYPFATSTAFQPRCIARGSRRISERHRRLNDDWRIIDCKDSIQWLLQVRRGGRWRGRSYCTTREGLRLYIRERAGEVDPAAQAVIAALPARCANEVVTD
jgi:hypothetical protein